MIHLWETVKIEVLKKENFFVAFFVAVLYIALASYSINYRLVLSTIAGPYELLYKFKILFYLLIGTKSALSVFDFFLLILISVLTALNIILIIRAIKNLRATDGIKFVFGGGTIFGFISTGCASCGLSLLAILGLGGAFAFLPFGNHTLYLISIGLLIFSLFFLLKKLHDTKDCKINN